MNVFQNLPCDSKYVEANGFSIVREYVGRCAGKDLHEESVIPHDGSSDNVPLKRPGYYWTKTIIFRKKDNFVIVTSGRDAGQYDIIVRLLDYRLFFVADGETSKFDTAK